MSRDAIHPENVRSLLVVLPTWVGDFVMATPALRAIRTRFARAKITFLLEPNLRELAEGGDWMEECLEWPDKRQRNVFHRSFRHLIASLRDRRFDLAVLLPNSFRAASTAWLGGATRIVGYARDARSFLLTDPVTVPNARKKRAAGDEREDKIIGDVVLGDNVPGSPSRYFPFRLVDYYANLLAQIGCPDPGDQFELFTTQAGEAAVAQRLESLNIDADNPIVVISPGAKYGASKCWMPDRFAAVADRLVEAVSAHVLITCGPGEEQMALDIERAMQRRGHALHDPRLSLGALKSLIRRAALILCTDAGPRHIGKAFGIGVVTVFGPTHPEWSATAYERERTVRVNIDCGPCQQRSCPLSHHDCMKNVTVDAVYQAARNVLAGCDVAAGSSLAVD